MHFKTFFRTTVFRAIVLGGFGLYMKWFNADWAMQTSNFLVKNPQTVVTEQTRDTILAKLDALSIQLQQVTKDNGNTDTGTAMPTATTPTNIKLFYFNEIQDSTLSPSQQINSNSIMPIDRTIKNSTNLIEDTIKALLQGTLTEKEKNAGFTTEFPNPKFTLLNTQLDSFGTLTLTFTEVPGFTDGGSARMLIMSKSIEKTALQFPEVKKVIFQPATLFQP